MWVARGHPQWPPWGGTGRLDGFLRQALPAPFLQLLITVVATAVCRLPSCLLENFQNGFKAVIGDARTIVESPCCAKAIPIGVLPSSTQPFRATRSRPHGASWQRTSHSWYQCSHGVSAMASKKRDRTPKTGYDRALHSASVERNLQTHLTYSCRVALPHYLLFL